MNAPRFIRAVPHWTVLGLFVLALICVAIEFAFACWFIQWWRDVWAP